MFPIRCFDCRRVIGNRHEAYIHLTSTPFGNLKAIDKERLARSTGERVIGPNEFLTTGEVLTYLKVKSPCCRLRFLCHVDIPKPNTALLEENTRVKFLNKRVKEDDSSESEEKKGRTILAR